MGVDPAADSDFDPVTGQVSVVLTGPHDNLTVDAGLWRTWQNARNPLDVNDDGVVVPLDVLLLINDINSRGTRSLPIPPLAPLLPPPYLDINGDGQIGPLDALIVINYLNNVSAGGEGEAAAWPLVESERGEGLNGGRKPVSESCAGWRTRFKPSWKSPVAAIADPAPHAVRQMGTPQNGAERDVFFARWDDNLEVDRSGRCLSKRS